MGVSVFVTETKDMPGSGRGGGELWLTYAGYVLSVAISSP